MVAQRNPHATIKAIEVDQQAATQAQHNADESAWSSRITVINQSIQDYQREVDNTFDHIITNPPFFTGGTLSNSQNKSSVRHTTKLSHNDLLGAIRNLLKPAGTCSLILPDIEGYRCIELARTYNLYPQKVTTMEQKIYGFQYGQDYPEKIVDIEQASRYARQTLSEFRKRPDVQKEAERIVRKHTNESSKVVTKSPKGNVRSRNR